MIRVQTLKQPNKHSGAALEPGKSIEVSGIKLKNNNSHVVYVDTYERKPWKPAKKPGNQKKKQGQKNDASA